MENIWRCLQAEAHHSSSVSRLLLRVQTTSRRSRPEKRFTLSEPRWTHHQVHAEALDSAYIRSHQSRVHRRAPQRSYRSSWTHWSSRTCKRSDSCGTERGDRERQERYAHTQSYKRRSISVWREDGGPDGKSFCCCSLNELHREPSGRSSEPRASLVFHQRCRRAPSGLLQTATETRAPPREGSLPASRDPSRSSKRWTA
ncbi:hypothetical protein ROHU_008585 [Labeo rohita]|uniref:Uncharacterized protein n=1 Tax=Labeo rohita TaxID=84645 RepID=A0A498M9F6_LABRO|nr:hypothetical protein ROHU_008585 [Labeo rohita]